MLELGGGREGRGRLPTLDRAAEPRVPAYLLRSPVAGFESRMRFYRLRL